MTTLLLVLNVLFFVFLQYNLVQAIEESQNPISTNKLRLYWEKAWQKTQIELKKTWTWIGYQSGIGEQCSFKDHAAASVREQLHSHLRAQDRALESVVSAIEAWEFSRNSAKDRTPLILAITGPTGTGKTETSNLVAEGLFKDKKKLKNSDKEVASGLLVFRGEDFNDNYTNPISDYHSQIKHRLADHLSKCSGKAVVVFDEVQKVIPHTLDVLMEAMSSRPQLTYYKDGVARTIDCSHVIFILVSDIGADKMLKLILAYNSRDKVPQSELVSSVKDSLDAQWQRLNFGKMINAVVPFLPLEPRHIADIIGLKLVRMDKMYQKKYWKSLRVEEGIIEYLAQSKFLKYENHAAKVNGKLVSKVYAKYGARNVENSGPIQRLKSKLFRYLRPWNKDAEVVVSLVPKSDEIRIESCYSSHVSSDFDKIKCEEKWIGKI